MKAATLVVPHWGVDGGVCPLPALREKLAALGQGVVEYPATGMLNPMHHNLDVNVRVFVVFLDPEALGTLREIAKDYADRQMDHVLLHLPTGECEWL